MRRCLVQAACLVQIARATLNWSEVAVRTSPTRALDLRKGRRLQLAARARAATGLCLIPNGIRSNATETLWHAAPLLAAGDSTLRWWKTI